MKVLGITGGTGSGKTTVLQVLQDHGAAVLDCDRIYYELLQTSENFRRELEETFGEVFLPDGSLNRKKLGKLVFGDEKSLRKLNTLIYYYMGLEVRRRLSALKQEGRELAAIDAVNLIDSGLGELCNWNVAVTAPAEVRLARIMARDGIDREYALSRIQAQPPEEYYTKHCHKVLCNHGTAEELRQQTEMLLKDFMST